MIVSLCSVAITDDSVIPKLKKHLKNAVEYAITEGGRVFLSESEGLYGTVCKEIMKEICDKYNFVSYTPVENTDSATSKCHTPFGYTEETPLRRIRNYLIEKADFVIICEPKEVGRASFPAKNKNFLCIKI